MPDLDLAQLAHDLVQLRSGLGPRRAELRQRLAAVDSKLRRERNIERLRQADLKARLAMLDSRPCNGLAGCP